MTDKKRKEKGKKKRKNKGKKKPDDLGLVLASVGTLTSEVRKLVDEFDAIKLDGTFRLLEKSLGRMVNNTYDGVDLNYLMRNSDPNEQENIKAFKNRITTVWAMDLDNIDTETTDFWVENRDYIQDDRVMKHILFERIRN